MLKLCLKAFALPVSVLFAVASLTACSQMFAGGVGEETNTVAGANPDRDLPEDVIPAAENALVGTLEDASGNPVSGVVVTAISCDSASIVYAATTDEFGQFSMVLEHQGEYGLSGSTGSEAFYDIVEYVGTPITVNLRLSGTGTIKGRMDASLAKTEIELTVIGTPWKAVSDMNGNFEMEGVPQGILPVYAESNGKIYADVIYVVSVDSGSSEFSEPVYTKSYRTLSFTIDSLSETTAVENLSSSRITQSLSSSSMMAGVVGIYSSSSTLLPSVGRDSSNASEPEINDGSGMGGTPVNSGVEQGLQMPYGVDYGMIKQFDMDSIQGGKLANILEAGAMFDSTEALVVEGWVKINSVDGADKPYNLNIVGVYPQQGGGAGLFSLAVIDGMCNVSGPHFAFFRGDASGSFTCGNVAVNPSAYRLGSWAYLTAVWDFDTGILVLYVDGEAVARAYSGAAPNVPTTDPMHFGDAMLDLSMEQVRIGSKPLRIVDVRYRYNYYGGAR